MDADTMREFVADIGAESDRLTRMAQKLLTLSRASADETEGGEHEVVDVGQTLSRVFRMLVPLADRQSVKLTASVEKRAARFCPLRTMRIKSCSISWKTASNITGKTAASMSGCGMRKIPLSSMWRIPAAAFPKTHWSPSFNRFYRVDKARSRQAGGAGLGLSIVHEMVGRNFGTISVRSTVGEGSCFTVTFPSFGSGEEDDPDA